jgi:hypothetical protein
MDGVNKGVDQELLEVNLNGKNVDQVTWVVFVGLWYGALDEAERTLVTCRRWCNNSDIWRGSLVDVGRVWFKHI